jgi:hypothetical protein
MQKLVILMGWKMMRQMMVTFYKKKFLVKNVRKIKQLPGMGMERDPV